MRSLEITIVAIGSTLFRLDHPGIAAADVIIRTLE